MAQKITHWLLITLILSLGFGQLLRFEFYGLPIYLHDILVLCILILNWRSLLVKNKVPNFVFTGLPLILLGLALGWLRALILFPLASLLVPSLYTFRLLAYLAMYFTLRRTPYAVSHTHLLLSGAIALMIGLTQYIFMPDMRIFQYLGWDDHLNRLTLPHFDPTYSGIMLSLALLSLPKFTVHRLPYAFGLMLGILLTYARSVWLSLFLTAISFIKNKKILLLAVCCTLLAILILPRQFGEGTNLLRAYSIRSRYSHDILLLKKLGWNSLTGIGMNTLSLGEVSHATGPNNSYLYIFLTSGIVGVVGWGIFLKNLYAQSAHKPVVLFILFASLFNNVLFYPFVMLWLFLLSVKD